ncbi:phosphotransferase [Micromonospora sp. MH33]|uniref:phosphotransferase n=1 Tax=Micromonospora sp. MH33 TaxID=1945509 RepID=UPI001FEFDDC7|nr:phosphotransferase [Micromonospora sp. MH33]
MAALLDRPSPPTAFYKDPNIRNYLVDGEDIAVVDFDDLTLAAFGYDLAGLLVTASMTYGRLDEQTFAYRVTSDRPGPARLRDALTPAETPLVRDEPQAVARPQPLVQGVAGGCRARRPDYRRGAGTGAGEEPQRREHQQVADDLARRRQRPGGGDREQIPQRYQAHPTGDGAGPIARQHDHPYPRHRPVHDADLGQRHPPRRRGAGDTPTARQSPTPPARPTAVRPPR